MQDFVNLKIFDSIDKGIVKKIIDNCEMRIYQKWEIILLEWAPSNWEWYIIKSWEVIVSIKWKEVAKLWIWEIFWEIALLNEEERTATICANSDIELIVLNQDSIMELINNWNDSINKSIMDRIEENLKNN